MASSFEIKEHVVKAQHVREYPHATAHSQDEKLYLAVKQYIPKSNPNPQPGDITIIAGHANGFVKELYEPLWEDLVRLLADRGVRVRSIFIADAAPQGQSGVINEKNLGNDPSWIDHARDLLTMINQLSEHMPRPLVGIGHSFGAAVMVMLSLMHPRLLSSLVLLDPVLSRFQSKGPKYGFQPMKNSAFRRDHWPSRAEAAASFKRNKFYQTWDPRALDAFVRYGLRDTPTPLYPTAGAVTLTTTKHMECFTYYRPQAQAYDAQGNRFVDLSLLPDADELVSQDPDYVFYRAEPSTTARRLPELRPGVLWVFGEHSDVNPPDVRAEKLQLTGTGVGGSGGVAKGRVRAEVIKGYGHLVPMEATTRCAELAAEFLAKDLEFWRAEEREFQTRWLPRTDEQKQKLDADWARWLGPAKGKL